MKMRALIATALLAVMVSPLRAATITATTTADSGPGSLRDALANAADGDTIDFSVAGTILLTSGELLVSNSVDIIGPGPGNLAVDGNAASRVFHIAPSNIVTVASLAITNGTAAGPRVTDYSGGGIFNDHSSLTVSNCTVEGHSSGSDGGGIFNNGVNFGSATLTLINSVVNGNSGGGLGGGIFNHHATLTVINSTLSGNFAGIWGGGVNNNHGTLTVISSSICSNSVGPSYSALSAGGGISINGRTLGDATVTIVGTTISDNSVTGAGGGIVNGSGTLILIDSTLSGNSAVLGFLGDGFGGGIVNWSGPSSNTIVQVVNCTLSGNSAAVAGGGIYNASPPTGSAPLEIGNTILNAGASGDNITNYSGTVTSLGYNLSSDDGSGLLTATGDQINTNPKLGPLQDNGGPTFTHALLCGSPAIDQGKRDTIPEWASDTDQRGLPRPVDFPSIANATGGDGSDIGAFEVQVADTTPPVISTVSVDKPVLWPPNHKLVNVVVRYQVADNCDPSPVSSLSVTNNEPIMGKGAGHTSPDWVIVDAHHVRLRAARLGKGNGRIYTITITGTNNFGNVTTQTVNVTVPKNIRKAAR